MYEVKVRMENDSTRTFELAAAVSTGSKVTAEGNSLRLADGSLVTPIQRAQPQKAGASDPSQAGG